MRTLASCHAGAITCSLRSIRGERYRIQPLCSGASKLVPSAAPDGQPLRVAADGHRHARAAEEVGELAVLHEAHAQRQIRLMVRRVLHGARGRGARRGGRHHHVHVRHRRVEVAAHAAANALRLNAGRAAC